jgi:glycerol-1-phosphate dehydrogenase [NAD(P)+]
MSTDAPASTDACPGCGGHHTIPDTEVVIGHDTIGELVRILDGLRWRHVLVVSDVNTDAAHADAAVAGLRHVGLTVTRLSFPQAHGLLADEGAVAAVRALIASERPAGAVAIGSGTINDITRYATSQEGLGYVSVPTAASVDGFASNVAAMQFGGMKVTYPAQAPVAIVGDIDVLAAAPAEMTAWGLGDLLGKATAHFDWLLGSVVTGEVFCPVIEDRVLGPLNLCLDQPARLLAGGADGIEALLRGLIESGIAMAMMGTSRPASGAEHHLSHFWDLMAYRGLRPHAPHGLQVAYATGLVIPLQRFAMEHLADPLIVPLGEEPTGDERHWLGEQTDSEQIKAVRADKAASLAPHVAGWPPDAATVAADLDRLAVAADAFDRVAGALEAAGVPSDRAFVDVDADMAAATIRYANRMRNRFTVLDLLEAQGHLSAQAAELVANWR